MTKNRYVAEVVVYGVDGGIADQRYFPTVDKASAFMREYNQTHTDGTYAHFTYMMWQIVEDEEWRGGPREGDR